MKDNTMLYFILALMCIFIGVQFTYISEYTWLLIGLGLIILLALVVRFIYSGISYINKDTKEEVEKEENQTTEK